MDIEQKQAEHVDYFVKQASNLKGSALRNVIVEATSHPSLFAFAEILSVPNVLEGVYIESRKNDCLRHASERNSLGTLKLTFYVPFFKAYTKSYEVHAEAELEGTENAVFLDLLRMFAHGTWTEYKSVASRLPPLVPDQVLKLKQLTVLTLAETNKVLPYDVLIQELDVKNVRELEDFLINDCMYVGIVRGKLDQLRRCFEVQFAAGRDPRPGQLGSMIQTISNWLSTSDNLLVSIQEKIKWADNMSEMDKKHRKEVEERAEEVKKTLSFKADTEFRGHEEIFSEHGGVMDYEEDRSRPKRRRHPLG